MGPFERLNDWLWGAVAASVIVLLLAIGAQARAAGLDLAVTAGIGKGVFEGKPFERYGALGLRYGDAWKVQANAGYWLALGDREASAYFGSLQGGLEVVGQGGLFAQLMFGPGYISQPDRKLGSRFQFHLTGAVGIRDSAGRGLALQWIHFSNAGIVQPNQGRDIFPSIQLTAPLSRALGAGG
jgi:hypothetical protein